MPVEDAIPVLRPRIEHANDSVSLISCNPHEIEPLPSPRRSENLLLSLQRAAERARSQTKCSGAAIGVGDSRRMVCIASSGDRVPLPGTPIRGDYGLAAECIRTQKAVQCPDTGFDIRVDHQACQSLGIGSIIYVPISGPSQKIVGLLGVFASAPSHFVESDLLRLQNLAGSIGSLLNRKSGEEPLSAEASPEREPEIDVEGGVTDANTFVLPVLQQTSRSRVPIIMAATVAIVAMTASSMAYRKPPAVQQKTVIAPAVTASVAPKQPPFAAPQKITVIIDPGHGGRDQGATSATGLTEKELTLDIAQRLSTLLKEKLSVDVVMTRSDDSYVPLETRASLANDAHADFLISIHGNASSYEDVRGVETYYLRSSDQALTSNETDGQSSAEVTEPAEAAKSLAADVQAALLHGLREGKKMLRDRGVKPASFVILREVQMPAILAEVSFLSSSKDAVQLDSADYREKVAQALYKGIANHIARTKSGSVMASLKQGAGAD